MSKNQVIKSFSQNSTWVAPAGVYEVKVKSRKPPAYPPVGYLIDAYGNAYAAGTIVAGISNVLAAFGDNSGNNNSGQNIFMIDSKGDTYAIGNNGAGQLGINSAIVATTPTLVVGGLKYRQVVTDGSRSFFISSTGNVFACGDNTGGALGVGTVTAMSSPTLVVGGQKFDKVVAGGAAALGINRAGTLYSWGRNTSGILGQNNNVSCSSPVLVSGGRTYRDIVCVDNGTNFFAVTSANDLYGWGLNPKGELGDGTVVDKSSPTLVLGSKKWAQIAWSEDTAGTTMAGLDTSGQLWAWGINTHGQVGDGTIVDKSSPILVIGGQKFKQIFSGGNGSFSAITEDGSLYTWGNNTTGNLGLGDTAHRSSPVLVTGFKFRTVFSMVGSFQNVGITMDGQALAWGQGSSNPTILGANITQNILDQLQEKVVSVTPGASYAIVVSGIYSQIGGHSVGPGPASSLDLEYFA